LQLIYHHVAAFMKMEAAGGVLLVVAMGLALVLENSPLTSFYDSLLMIVGEVRIGEFSIEKPLVIWVNDLWMAIFFFLVGLEIKSELIAGHLSDRSRLVLPLLGALGGMLVPALVYIALNRHDPDSLYGWAIPMATDIAFALGVLSLLGSRVPIGARIFLMTLAIIDDLGAIIVIALFYTANLSTLSLSLAGLTIATMVFMNIRGVRNTMAYILAGMLLWICVLKSGVHATLAGVITALCIPWEGRDTSDDEPVNRLIDALHPWVVFGILPAFAFVNTGINFASVAGENLLDSVPVGIFLGLFIGKQVGVFSFAWLGIRLGLARLPTGVRTPHLYGVAVLCGIGFTMSLFIGGLALEEGGVGNSGANRLAILGASLMSAAVGYLIFRLSPTPPRDEAVRN
jgi:NhaA family Na+:H+ antiporter